MFFALGGITAGEDKARGIFSAPGFGRRRSQLVKVSESLCYQEALGVAIVKTAHEGWLVPRLRTQGRSVCIRVL